MPVSDHAAAGGKARSEKLSPQRRREIAIVAALKRWSRKKTEAEDKPTADSAPNPEQQPEPAKQTHVNPQGKYCPPATTGPSADYLKKANLGLHWEDGSAPPTDPYICAGSIVNAGGHPGRRFSAQLSPKRTREHQAATD
jgi:hypothetical protein